MNVYCTSVIETPETTTVAPAPPSTQFTERTPSALTEHPVGDGSGMFAGMPPTAVKVSTPDAFEVNVQVPVLGRGLPGSVVVYWRVPCTVESSTVPWTSPWASSTKVVTVATVVGVVPLAELSVNSVGATLSGKFRMLSLQTVSALVTPMLTPVSSPAVFTPSMIPLYEYSRPSDRMARSSAMISPSPLGPFRTET